MPAVDPVRLTRELDALAALVQDPDEATRACLSLLDFYADRTRRPKLASTADLARRFGVPAPVVRQLSRRLAESARALPDSGDKLANSLWDSGFRETRLAAAAIIGQRDDDGAPRWVEGHARGCDDSVVLSALGGQGLQAWQTTRPDAFLERVWSWIDASDPRLTALALIALGGAVNQADFSLGPNVFQGLESRLDELASQPRQALVELLRHLAVRSPAETAQMLKRHLKRRSGHPALTQAVRSALPHFPSRQRRVLEAALSAEDAG